MPTISQTYRNKIITGLETTPKEIADELAPEWKGHKILDMGCGDGFFLECVKPYAKSVTGVELDAGLARVAKRRGLTVMVKDMQKVDLKPFDLLIVGQYMQGVQVVYEMIQKQKWKGTAVTVNTRFAFVLPKEAFRIEVGGRDYLIEITDFK